MKINPATEDSCVLDIAIVLFRVKIGCGVRLFFNYSWSDKIGLVTKGFLLLNPVLFF